MNSSATREPGTQQQDAAWDIDRAQKYMAFVSSAGTQVVKVAIGLGGLLLIIYAAKERFYYDVSSLAAVGVLLVTLVIFGFLVVVGLLYGAMSSIFIIRLFIALQNWRAPQFKSRIAPYLDNWPVWVTSPLMMLFWCLAAYPVVSAGNTLLGWELGFFFAAGFVNACLFLVEPAQLNAAGRGASALAVTIMLLVMFSSGSSSLLDQAFMLLSLRSTPGEPIALSDKAHDRLAAIAGAEGFKVAACHAGTDIWLTRDVMLVWHGTGSVSFAALGEGTNHRLVVPLPSLDVDMIPASSRTAPPCPELATALTAASGGTKGD